MKSSWNFMEVWVDPMQSPPYLLLVLGDKSGVCHVFDPAESYRMVKTCESYDSAQLWLLEDEYEPLEGDWLGRRCMGKRRSRFTTVKRL